MGLEEKNELNQKISSNLRLNINEIDGLLDKSSDLKKRTFHLFKPNHLNAVIYFMDGLVNEDKIENSILSPMVYRSRELLNDLDSHIDPALLESVITEDLLANASVSQVETIGDGITEVLSGDTLLFVDKCDKGFVLSSKGWEGRGVDEPNTEPTVRGPRDGFVETLRTNTALIRRRIRDPKLQMEAVKLGKRSKTDVAIAYIDGLVREGLVDEVKERVNRIDMDAILESGYIEELISDAPMSPFMTVQGTERPDKVAAALYEGRVAIIVDNTPYVLVVPTHFWQFLQASDDYYNNFYMGSFFRFLRYCALFISLTLPSIFVMLVSFHQEMIPTPMALAIAAGREAIPFPVLLEALMMEFAFELMREAGLRMPKPIGAAVSIVGSLIIGQAAVDAGIVSPIMVIIVATTGIAAFAIPNYDASYSIRLIRFPLLLASGTMGLLGFAGVFSIIALHALSLRSFGEPYLSPIIPMKGSEQKDTLLRGPWWSNSKRPESDQRDIKRMGDNQKPSPGSENNSKGEDK